MVFKKKCAKKFINRTQMLLLLIICFFNNTSCVTYVTQDIIKHELHPRNELRYNEETSEFDGMMVRSFYDKKEVLNFIFPNILADRVNQCLIIKIDPGTSSIISITEENNFIHNFENDSKIILKYYMVDEKMIQAQQHENIIVMLPVSHKVDKSNVFRVIIYLDSIDNPSFDNLVSHEKVELNYIQRKKGFYFLKYASIPFTVAVDVLLSPVYLAGSIVVLVQLATGTYQTR